MAFVDASLKRMMFHRRLSLSFSLDTSFYLSLCLTALFLLFTCCEFQSPGLYLYVHFPVPKGVSCPSPHHNSTLVARYLASTKQSFPMDILPVLFLHVSSHHCISLFALLLPLSLLPDVSNTEIKYRSKQKFFYFRIISFSLL